MKTENAKRQTTGCEALPLLIRSLPTRALLALELIGCLDAAPHLIGERDARGKPFTRLLYRSAKGVWHGLYLGGLEANDEALLRARITGRWPVTNNELNRIIEALHAHRRQIRKRAHALASRCGYRFQGWLLRIPIGAKHE